jgi:diguanylate cyclase (GGDEF)-like protein
MKSIRAFLALFVVPSDNPDLMLSQLRASSRQVPLLYFILVVNTVALAFTHYGVAPNLLTIGFPLLVAAGCTLRVIAWSKIREEEMSEAVVRRRLKISVAISGGLGLAFVCWGLSLYRYGDAYTQVHVAFYLGITVASCIFCLMHVRPAALLLTAVVIVPFLAFFLSTGRPVFIAIALNMALVAGAMVYVLLIYSRDFASLIVFQKQLITSHRESQRLSDENLRLANLDSLTDLPNRRQFFDQLNGLVERCARERRRFAVGLIDLDGFKAINDLYGHVAGDKVLVESGRRMQEICTPSIFLARLGGDEFGVLLDVDVDDAHIEALSDRLCAALRAPVALAGACTQISGSIGFATYPEAGVSVESLFECADYALYLAKQHRRGRPVIFSSDHETEIQQFGKLTQCLRDADFDSEMSLHFQPIFDVEQGKPIAFEALARWDSPKLGRVPPDVFIRAAERCDVIHKLTQVLLRKALHAARAWPRDIRISFNLSVRDLTSREAILAIASIIENSGIAADRIDLEVTETAFMHDFDLASQALRMLKALGVGVSLDDFGVGYSSLSYIHRLPINRIKIDRSFIKDIETEATCAAVVKTVIELCRNLNFTCVIEGMETEAQVRIARSLGCRLMQGYWFGKPMPASDIPRFLNLVEPENHERSAAIA